MINFEPIHLAIGFTGHRDISPKDEDRLRGALRQRLGELDAENDPTPLRAITGLAEGLRVQLFWHLAGIGEPVADRYLQRQRSELRWIRDALRTVVTRTPATRPQLDIVHKHWIVDQSSYFTESAKREGRWHSRSSARVEYIFKVGPAVAAAVAILELARRRLDHDEAWVKALIILLGLLPALAAAIKGYAIKRAFAEHAKQYLRMSDVFALARADREHRPKDPNPADAQAHCLARERGACGECRLDPAAP
ncbi:MAG TPA: hypothetical protein VN823_29085 [Stellaceae bacterium]|nr:hypothetical protein [Stellaceae bacterium]